MRIVLTSIVLLFGGLLSAAPPKLVGKDSISIAAGKMTRVEVEPDGGKAVGWAVGAADDDLLVEELMSKGGKMRLLVAGQTAGKYYLIMWTIGETESIKVMIEVTGEKKQEDDTKPNPKPSPVGKVNWYIVTESVNRNPTYAPILADKQVKGAYTVVVVDPDTKDAATNQPPVKYKVFLDRAKGKPDQLYGLDMTTGDVVYEGAAPTSVGDFIKAVQSVK